MPINAGDRIQCMEVWGGNLRVEKRVEVPGLDIWLSSRPLDQDLSGGDVYYVSSCAAGRLTRILLADVSGHGRKVASIAEGLRDLMRKNIEIADHRQLVADMNRQFEKQTAAGIFATAVVTSFFAPSRKLLLCSAGHPPPLIYRRRTDAWTIFDESTAEAEPKNSVPSGLPLGILSETEYEQFRLRLAPGDAVLCYSDGFIEAKRQDGSLLGAEGLREIVGTQWDARYPELLIPRVVEAIDALHDDNVRHDDCTLVLYQATGVRFRIADQLTAPLRVMFSRVKESCRIESPRRVEKTV